MHRLGHTRSALRPDHLLQTPDAFVRTPLPGNPDALAIVHIAPAAGARFTQCTVELAAGATLRDGKRQRFLYVLSGEAKLVTVSATQDAEETNTVTDHLRAGSFAYLPQGVPHSLTAQTSTRLAMIEKPYQPGLTNAEPKPLLRHEQDVTPTPLGGDPDLLVQALMPEDPAYDFAVNLMTYAPGAALAQVEVHVMEHGLLMLEGGGIYRLGDCWYPVAAGDFIWMAPYCPQWFGALGKVPAKYLIYKDWNRTP